MSERIRIRLAPPSHPARNMGEPDAFDLLPNNARLWADKFGSDYHQDQAVIATHRGKLVGIWWVIEGSGSRVTSGGTWVAPKYRRQGLARRMWEYGMRTLEVTVVEGCSVTTAGRAFLRHMRFERDHRVHDDNAAA